MIDRKKVIKRLEEISDYFFSVYHHSKSREEINKAKYRCDAVEDAIVLLKDQEPKQAIGIADSIEGMEVGYCPSCDRAIVNKKIDETKFCKFCGQAVKWK